MRACGRAPLKQAARLWGAAGARLPPWLSTALRVRALRCWSGCAGASLALPSPRPGLSRGQAGAQREARSELSALLHARTAI